MFCSFLHGIAKEWWIFVLLHYCCFVFKNVTAANSMEQSHS